MSNGLGITAVFLKLKAKASLGDIIAETDAFFKVSHEVVVTSVHVQRATHTGIRLLLGNQHSWSWHSCHLALKIWVEH